MTKTPDEIKKGLECCSEDGCKKCPYWEDCNMADGFSELAGDALALIQQLEAERDEMMEYVHGRCPMCKHYASSIKEEPCASCYSASGHNDNWEWRGVQKEE